MLKRTGSVEYLGRRAIAESTGAGKQNYEYGNYGRGSGNERSTTNCVTEGTERTKPTFRDFLKRTPDAQGDKRMHFIGSPTAFIAVEDFRGLFQDVRDRKTLALYVLPASFISLRYVRTTECFRCASCGKQHEFGDISFCPRFSHGHPISELHGLEKESGEVCGHVTTVEEIAVAAL